MKLSKINQWDSLIHFLQQEDDLLVKVKEIVSHFEKIDDYHHGDGMRIQKMLSDMYWDYTPIRENIADCLADNGFAGMGIYNLCVD